MKKNIFIISLLCLGVCNGFGGENLIWYKIPHFYVSGYVNNFLDNRKINNCFYKFEDEDTLLLKCWRDKKLVDVEISIKNKFSKKRFIYESLSI